MFAEADETRPKGQYYILARQGSFLLKQHPANQEYHRPSRLSSEQEPGHGKPCCVENGCSAAGDVLIFNQRQDQQAHLR